MPQTTVLQLFDFFIFGDAIAFLIFIILLGGIAGLLARSLAVAGFGALQIFIHVALETDLFIFKELLFGILGVAFFIMAFQLGSYLLSFRQGGAA